MAFKVPLRSVDATVNNITASSGQVIRVGNSGNVFNSTTLYEVTGNVGIGTATPQNTLHVVGNIKISNTTTSGGIIFADGTFQSTAGGSSGPSSLTSYSVNIGNGVSNSITVTHNLNINNFFISVREISSGYIVYPDVKKNDANSLTIEFVTAPTSNQYAIIVIGA